MEAIGYIIDGSKCEISPTLIGPVPKESFSPKTLINFNPFVPSNSLAVEEWGMGLGDRYGVYSMATFVSRAK